MCLAVPGKIIVKKNNLAKADFGGISRQISLDLLPGVRKGDYVLVHAGFAIEKVDAESALETLKIFEEMYGG